MLYPIELRAQRLVGSLRFELRLHGVKDQCAKPLHYEPIKTNYKIVATRRPSSVLELSYQYATSLLCGTTLVPCVRLELTRYCYFALDSKSSVSAIPPAGHIFDWCALGEI